MVINPKCTCNWSATPLPPLKQSLTRLPICHFNYSLMASWTPSNESFWQSDKPLRNYPFFPATSLEIQSGRAIGSESANVNYHKKCNAYRAGVADILDTTSRRCKIQATDSRYKTASTRCQMPDARCLSGGGFVLVPINRNDSPRPRLEVWEFGRPSRWAGMGWSGQGIHQIQILCGQRVPRLISAKC